MRERERERVLAVSRTELNDLLLPVTHTLTLLVQYNKRYDHRCGRAFATQHELRVM
jgi:hypothetical protein